MTIPKPLTDEAPTAVTGPSLQPPPPSTLDIIMEWFDTLPQPIRVRFSLAQLHGLSKLLRDKGAVR